MYTTPDKLINLHTLFFTAEVIVLHTFRASARKNAEVVAHSLKLDEGPSRVRSTERNMRGLSRAPSLFLHAHRFVNKLKLKIL